MSDYDYSRLDRLDGLPRTNSDYYSERAERMVELVAKVRTSPIPYIALVSIVPDEPVKIRRHVPALAVVALALLVAVAALLALAVQVSS
jgi:hypothetical protein